MPENDPACWLVTAGRASNEELRTWLFAGEGGDTQSFPLLLQAAAPLLLAYFEGQLRGRRADLEVLTLETLVALYRHRARLDPRRPFRAWLLDLARQRLAEHLRGERARQGPLPEGAPEPAPEAESEMVRRLRRLARKQVEGMLGRRGPRRTPA